MEFSEPDLWCITLNYCFFLKETNKTLTPSPLATQKNTHMQMLGQSWITMYVFALNSWSNMPYKEFSLRHVSIINFINKMTFTREATPVKFDFKYQIQRTGLWTSFPPQILSHDIFHSGSNNPLAKFLGTSTQDSYVVQSIGHALLTKAMALS